MSVFETQKCTSIEDGYEIQLNNDFHPNQSPLGQTSSLIRTSRPIPRDAKEFYFETKIANKVEIERPRIGVGFSSKIPVDNYDYDKMTRSTNAVAFICDGGEIVKGEESLFRLNELNEVLVCGDIIGCRLRSGCAAGNCHQVVEFYKNGKKIGFPLAVEANKPLYPSIWIGTPRVTVEINLGQIVFKYEQIQGTGMFQLLINCYGVTKLEQEIEKLGQYCYFPFFRWRREKEREEYSRYAFSLGLVSYIISAFAVLLV